LVDIQYDLYFLINSMMNGLKFIHPTNLLLNILTYTCAYDIYNKNVANEFVGRFGDNMERLKLKRAQGNWVTGDRFWDREHEIRELINYLDDGAHVLIVAPRRIGKTSLMREAARVIDGRYICLHVDLQKAKSPSDAIVELSITTFPHSSLWEKTRSVFSNVFDQITGRIDSVKFDDVTVALRSGLNSGNWQAKGDRLFEMLASAEREVVIFFDEVPILVNRLLKGDDYKITPERRQEADAFMSWLRANSTRYKERVRLVVTGSIGIEPVLRQAGLSATLNTFTPLDIGPWNVEIATGCIRALANEYRITITQDVAERMVDKLGYCIPHHVEMFFEKVYLYCRRNRITTVTEAQVDEVYQTGMLSVRGHVELSHMEERLKMVLGPDLHPLTLELLTEAAITAYLTADAADILSQEYNYQGQDKADILREIMSILEHDGYLRRREDDRYTFQSKLLKDWWRARFGFGFKTSATRKGYSNEDIID
jgi:hypothetical protein